MPKDPKKETPRSRRKGPPRNRSAEQENAHWRGVRSGATRPSPRGTYQVNPLTGAGYYTK